MFFTNSLVHWFAHWLTHSWVPELIRWIMILVQKFSRGLIFSQVHLLHWFTHSFTYWLVPSFTDSFMDSLVDSFIHWFVWFAHRFFHVIDFIIGILTTNCSFADAHHNLNLSFLFNPKRIPIGHCSHGSFSKSPHWHGRALSGMAKIQLWHSKCM